MKTKKRNQTVAAVMGGVALLSALAAPFDVNLLFGAEPDAATGIDQQRRDERKRRFWDRHLPPAEYSRALEATGVLANKEVEVAVATMWLKAGPFGDFPQAAHNGRMRSIFLRATRDAYQIYAGASSGGLWISLVPFPNGAWASFGETLPNPAVAAIDVDPTNADVIFVGTGDWARYSGAGMYKTTDGGVTWTQVPLPVSPRAFFQILRHPSNSDLMYACCSEGAGGGSGEGGVLRSIDRGATWSLRLSGECTSLVMDPNNGSRQYAAMTRRGVDGINNGIYVTSNGWTSNTSIRHANLPSGTAFGRATLAISDGVTPRVAVLVDNGGDPSGIYQSTDGGVGWTDITPTVGSFSQVWHAQALAYRPGRALDMFAGSVDLIRTTDGGQSWHLARDDNIDAGHADITNLVFSPVTGPNVMWIMNDGGIYQQTLGVGLESWNGAGPTGLNCSQVHVLDAERYMGVIGLQDNGVLESFNSLGTWNRAAAADGFGVEITDQIAKVYWYIDGFWSDPLPTLRIWRKAYGVAGREAPIARQGSGWHESVFHDRYSDRMFLPGELDVRSSPESGTLAWTVDVNVASVGYGKHVFGSRLRPNELYLTYWDFPVISVLRKSGTTWSHEPRDLGWGSTVEQIYVSTDRAGESWAGAVGGGGQTRILHTVDYWQTWEDITGSLTAGGAIDAIAVTPLRPEIIYVGTEIGVFRSTDGGQTWGAFQTGLPVVAVTDINYVADPTHAVGQDKLVASTFGRGVYSRFIDAPALIYVDPGNLGTEEGTFDHPHNSLGEGITHTPSGGTLVLRGDDYSVSSQLLNTQMLLTAYDGTAWVGR